MKRETINENELGKVVGGSIIFNGAGTTCGYNRNDEYQVVDTDAALNYMIQNITSMDERDILSNLVAAGLLIPIE